MSENDKGKNTIMKMLLSTAPVVSTPSQVSAAFVKTKQSPLKTENPEECGEEFRLRLKRYFQKLAKQGQCNDVNELINEDHCYSKPWNSRPDRSFMNPVKTLFVPKSSQMLSASTSAVGDTSEDVIDVEGDEPQFSPPFDATEADMLADECERHAGSVRADAGADDWEERVNRIGWSVAQNRLFSRVVRVLHADRLNRLALSSTPGCESRMNRPMLRRLAVDCAARRVRQALASASWDFRLVTWLHSTLIECLSAPYLASYLDILQTLRTKIPSLIDKMISAVKTTSTNSEALELILKRSWDPVSMQLSRSLPQSKLPGNPLLVVVPSGPSKKRSPGDKISKRKQSWMQYYSSLAKLVTVPSPQTRNERGEKLTFGQYTALMASTTRAKLRELRATNISSPIFLIGWGQGALLACQVSLVEPVTAVICLGFPMNTVEGNRGEPDDSILDMHCPVYFIIGQKAATVSSDDVEDLRERMHVETNLLVIGGADDLLRVPKAKMKFDGLTQPIVDRCIMDEVADFIGGILTRPPAGNLHQSSQSTVVRSVVPVLPSSVALVEVGAGGARRGGAVTSARERRNRGALPLSGEAGDDTVLPLSAPTAKRARFGNTTGGTPGTVQRRKPRSQTSQKMMLTSMNFQSKDKWSTTQFISSRQAVTQSPQTGITVNIGSLASLAPIGPLKLSQPDSTSSDAGASAEAGGDESLGKGFTGTIGNMRTGTLTGSTHSNTLTTLSSLLQQHSSNSLPKTVRVSSAPSTSLSPGMGTSSNIIISPSTQIKVMSNSEERGQISPTTRIISGRTVDLSKLALLTGGPGSSGTKGIVMLTDSVRGGSGGGPMLVPLSTAAGVSPNSPIAILPLTPTRDVSGGGVAMASHHGRRTLAMVPRITVSSVKVPTQTSQEGHSSSIPSVPDGSHAFNPESILELPIIFAKDGEDPAMLAGGVPSAGMSSGEAKAMAKRAQVLGSSSLPLTTNPEESSRGVFQDERSMTGEDQGESQLDMGGGMDVMRGVIPSSDTGEESEEDASCRVLMAGQSPINSSPRGRRGRRPFTPAVLGGTRTRRIRTPKHFSM